MTQSARELYELLRQPFAPDELEWRVIRSGKNDRGPWAIVVPYVQRPAIVNRLNQVCGLDGWASDVRIVSPAIVPAHTKSAFNKTVEVSPFPVGHVAVGVGIKVEGEWVWRWNGSGMLEPDPPHFSASDAGKGDFSNGFKRAAEELGVGVYLREMRGPFFAIFNTEGRYNNKVAGEWLRWDPPGLGAQPKWTGELTDKTVPKKDDPVMPQPPTDPAERAAQEEQQQKEEATRVKDMKRKVGQFMERVGYYAYHLEAVLLTHPALKHRYQTVEDLKRLGTAQDWSHMVELTERNKDRWEQAPRELATDFPTNEERVGILRKLMQKKHTTGRETVTINAAIGYGWSDGVEFWIQQLEARDE